MAPFFQNRADFSKISSILLLSIIDNKAGYPKMGISIHE